MPEGLDPQRGQAALGGREQPAGHEVRRHAGSRRCASAASRPIITVNPTSGPPGRRSPWSSVCWTAIGTTTWPSEASTARNRVNADALLQLGGVVDAATDRLQRARCRRRCPCGCRRCARRGSGAHRRRPLRLLLVGVDQVGVGGAAVEQLGVGAAVGDPAVLEVDHLVGQRDGRLAVGHDDQRRPAPPCGRGAGRPGSAPRPRGRPRRWRRRGSAAAAGGRGRGPGRSAAAARRRATYRARPAGCRARRRGRRRTRRPGRRGARPRPRSSGMSAPRVTLPRTVSSKRKAVCGTTAQPDSASSPRARSRRSVPSSRIRPPSGSTRRVSRVVSVLLPEAVAPTSGDGAARVDREGDAVEQRLRRGRRRRRGGRGRAGRRHRPGPRTARRRTASRRWPRARS